MDEEALFAQFPLIYLAALLLVIFTLNGGVLREAGWCRCFSGALLILALAGGRIKQSGNDDAVVMPTVLIGLRLCSDP